MEGARVQNDGASDDGASSADALDVTRVSVGAIGEASARTSIARVLVDVAGAALDEDSVDDGEGEGTPEVTFDGSLASFTPLARAIDAARLEFDNDGDDEGVADVYGDFYGDGEADASTPPFTHASTRASIHASTRASIHASDDRCDSPSKERVDAFVRSARRRRRDALLDETMAERDAVAFELARRAASSGLETEGAEDGLETEGAEDDATETPSKVSESPSRQSNITPVVRSTTRRLGSATRASPRDVRVVSFAEAEIDFPSRGVAESALAEIAFAEIFFAFARGHGVSLRASSSPRGDEPRRDHAGVHARHLERGDVLLAAIVSVVFVRRRGVAFARVRGFASVGVETEFGFGVVAASSRVGFERSERAAPKRHAGTARERRAARADVVGSKPADGHNGGDAREARIAGKGGGSARGSAG